jgi:hypothetical protein
MEYLSLKRCSIHVDAVTAIAAGRNGAPPLHAGNMMYTPHPAHHCRPFRLHVGWTADGARQFPFPGTAELTPPESASRPGVSRRVKGQKRLWRLAPKRSMCLEICLSANRI